MVNKSVILTLFISHSLFSIVICNVICAPEKPALELNAIINPTDDGIVDIPDLTGDSISRAFLHFSSISTEFAFKLLRSKSKRFYDASCPNLTRIVRYGVWMAVSNDTRMAASLLRLHFHDCFVNGCDGSLLLDDTNTFKGEKNALPNVNSVRGYEVIDNIKAVLEKVCPCVVSCTDIVTLAAREAVYLAGGPFWQIPLGRRDGTTASESEANQLPSPLEPLENIIAKFTSKGLNVKDLVALSGAHTFGFARCMMFKHRLFNFDGAGNPDPELDVMLRQNLENNCPNQDDSNNNFAPLDAYTINRFDNVYYRNLVNKLGLLQSDQALMKDNTTASLVVNYSRYPYLFYRDFGASMVKLANTGILTGQKGEIRKNCRMVN